MGDELFYRAANDHRPPEHFSRRTQCVQEGGEGRALVFGDTCLERFRKGGSVLKTIQHIEHAEALAGIRHVLCQRLLALQVWCLLRGGV